MKTYLIPSLKLTALLLVLLSGIYPLVVAGISKLAVGGGGGETITMNGKVVGFANVGQKFTEARFFQGRPSAVEYNAAGSGGSNKSTSNPDYLRTVQARLDSFLVQNPNIGREQVPAELITASGSGLDPDISPEAAMVQVPRVAQARKLPQETVRALVQEQVQGPLLGLFGPSKVNVLQLNLALEKVK